MKIANQRVAACEVAPGTVVLHEDGTYYLTAEAIAQDTTGRVPKLVALESGLICDAIGFCRPFLNARIQID